MLFSRINLKTELIRERGTQQQLLNEVHRILNESSEKDADVLKRLNQNSDETVISSDQLNEAEKARIFRLEEIKNLCIKYRLRFLDSSCFKQEYPYQAISEIRAFEKKYSVRIRQFCIVAPDHSFKLENINKDPLLFARLSDNTYYLIHQWGDDLAWYKRYTLWPLRSFRNIFISLWMLAAGISFLIPSAVVNVLNFEAEIYLRLWLTVHIFIGLFGFTIWGGMTFDKYLSNQNWNSKYYNG